MSADDEGKDAAAPAPKSQEAAAREARLARALRANLKRRKAAPQPPARRPPND